MFLFVAVLFIARRSLFEEYMNIHDYCHRHDHFAKGDEAAMEALLDSMYEIDEKLKHFNVSPIIRY